MIQTSPIGTMTKTRRAAREPVGEASFAERVSARFEIARLGEVGEGQRPGLPAVGAVRHFSRDRAIYQDGDAAEYFFRLASGLVRTCTFLGDGRRQIDSFYGPEDVFGLEIGGEHHLHAEAARDCAVVLYRRRDLDRMAANSELFSRQLWLHAMRGLTRAREHSIILGRRCALEKVAAFLIERAAHARERDEIVLPMTRRDIADYLGLTLETISRMLTELQERNLITLITSRRIGLTNADGLHALNH